MDFKSKAFITENDEIKEFRSSEYNFRYYKKSGIHLRWGKTLNDDPDWSPYGPEILDLEISYGNCSGKCPFCYKQNGADQSTHNMTLEEFRTILMKMPQTLSQIAFGICDIDTNLYMWPMMEHARANGIVPNYTCNGLGIDDYIAEKTKDLCGAVAVSMVNKSLSLQAVKRFVKAGMEQVNIHYMLSEETYERAFKLVEELKDIEGFRAIVFLQYKPKGRYPNSFHVLPTTDRYTKLTDHCQEQGVAYGFDSCSCPSWYYTIKDDPLALDKSIFGEPCESALFSSYINANGKFFPCSFTEGEEGWIEGLDVLNCDNFLEDVWMNSRIIEWRDKLINSSQDCDCTMKRFCRSCPVFNVTPCHV